jgi:hypothetical protein
VLLVLYILVHRRVHLRGSGLLGKRNSVLIFCDCSAGTMKCFFLVCCVKSFGNAYAVSRYRI